MRPIYCPRNLKYSSASLIFFVTVMFNRWKNIQYWNNITTFCLASDIALAISIASSSYSRFSSILVLSVYIISELRPSLSIQLWFAPLFVQPFQTNATRPFVDLACLELSFNWLVFCMSSFTWFRSECSRVASDTHCWQDARTLTC